MRNGVAEGAVQLGPLLGRPTTAKRFSTFSDELPADQRYSGRIFKYTVKKKP